MKLISISYNAVGSQVRDYAEGGSKLNSKVVSFG